MQTVCNVVLSLTIFLNSIELGSQSRCFPLGDRKHGDSRCDASSPSSRRPSSSSGNPPPTELTLRARSRSPPAIATPSASSLPSSEPSLRVRFNLPALKQTFPRVLGFRFDELESIRLAPHENPDRIYELRRYVFPPNKPIQLKGQASSLRSIPMGEQIVLSTPNGDVYGVLERTSTKKQTLLRGLYKTNSNPLKRAKISMESGEVEELTPLEKADCPLTNHHTLSNDFRIFQLGSQSRCPGNSSPSELPLRARSRSPPATDTSSARSLPSSEPSQSVSSQFSDLKKKFPRVLGFKFDELEFIRLAPYKNPNRIFELRRYVFPPNEPIKLKGQGSSLRYIPLEEQIVLSTPNGDVYGILDKLSSNKQTILRGLYKTTSSPLERAKISMETGEVEELTQSEKADCPLTNHHALSNNFRIFRA